MNILQRGGVILLAAATIALGGCGGSKPVAMPIDVVLAQDVAATRSAQVDVTAVGAGEQQKFAAKPVGLWFRGGDPDRAMTVQAGSVASVFFTPGGPNPQTIAESDAFWKGSLARQGNTLFVFASVAGEESKDRDGAWRKELPLDPDRYDGGRIRLEVQKTGIVAVNLKPEPKK
ncbi:hypothetical protein BH11PLA1_BH11PLA1_17720 [soil metagenome]